MTSVLSSRTFEKVTTFVLRRVQAGTELLTFLHPSAGRQLPAGSVERAEKSEVAAAREVLEETGVGGLQDLVQIGENEVLLQNQLVAARKVVLRDASGARIGNVPRGHRVAILTTKNGHACVMPLLYNCSVGSPEAIAQPCGWADADGFSQRLHRRFFAARVNSTGPAKWENQADGHRFVVEWLPLSKDIGLIEEQQAWLETHFETLQLFTGDPFTSRFGH